MKVGAKSFLLEIIKELHYYKDVKIPTVFHNGSNFTTPVTLALAILQYCYYPSIKSSILRAGEWLRGVTVQHEPGFIVKAAVDMRNEHWQAGAAG